MEKYFTEEDGKVILQTIRNTLSVLNSQDISDEAKLETSDIQLKAILESLSLSAPEIHPGLGELNLPCYKESAETGIEDFNSKVKESSDAVKEKEKKYFVGTVKGFIASRWTLEYCLAMSCFR